MLFQIACSHHKRRKERCEFPIRVKGGAMKDHRGVAVQHKATVLPVKMLGWSDPISDLSSPCC